MKRIHHSNFMMITIFTLFLIACQPKATPTAAPTALPKATEAVKFTATKAEQMQATSTSTITSTSTPTRTLGPASQTLVANYTTPNNTRTTTKSPTVPPGGYIEDFNTNAGFASTSNKLTISGGLLNWTVARNGGAQWIYRSIPSFSGNMRLTVIGTVKSATNNCQVKAGIGNNGPGTGISLDFGYFGGGCSFASPVVMVGNASMDYYDKGGCVFTGNWLKIKYNTAYKAVLTLTGKNVTASVAGVGTANGTTTYTGQFNTLYVGLSGDGDWPSCSGTIDQMIIEPLK